MNPVILNLVAETGTLSMINWMLISVQEMTSCIAQKCLKSNLCDYNGAYILVRGNITIAGNIAARVVFIKCAPFIKCITKIDGEQ